MTTDRPLVFIVDDQEPNVRLLGKILARADIAEFRGYTDPSEALAAARTDDPDLVILDLQMPRVDGFAFLTSLRASRGPDDFVPILVVTADVTREARQRALELGATDFLTKPIDAEEVIARCRNLLRTRHLHLVLKAQNSELVDDLEVTTVRSRAALAESERRLAEAQRIGHVGSWERELGTDVLTWSDESCRIFGIPPGTFAGTLQAFLGFVHPDDRSRAVRRRASADASWRRDIDYRIIRADGTERVVHEEAELVRDTAGRPVRYSGTTQDITERVAAEAERTRLAAAVEHAADAIWIHDLGGSVTYVNPSFSRVYGYPREEIVGRHGSVLDSGIHDPAFWVAVFTGAAKSETWRGTVTNRRRDGSHIEVDTAISAILDADGKVSAFVQADRDVSRERALERALELEASQRAAIEAALRGLDPGATPEEIALAACSEIVGLSAIDAAWAIDLAHGRGVILAQAAAEGVRFEAARPLPAARVRHLLDRARGGPWIESWADPSEPDPYAEGLAATGIDTVLMVPLIGADQTVGVVGFGARGPDGSTSLVDRMPAFTTFGAIVGALLAPALESRHHAQAERVAIQAIIDRRALVPVFQPIVDLRTRRAMGYEALTRFEDGRRPDHVFGAAVSVGLGIELERVCLRVAIQESDVLPVDRYLSLNVSPELVLSGQLGPLIAGIARPIVLELTEHRVIDDYASLRRALATLSVPVRIAVDDAGAGYSSFRHILELEPDFVKLDIGLVRSIDTDPARQALIAGLGYFAAKRKIRLIAEGIETAAEAETLTMLGVALGQGYFLGRPGAVAALTSVDEAPIGTIPREPPRPRPSRPARNELAPIRPLTDRHQKADTRPPVAPMGGKQSRSAGPP